MKRAVLSSLLALAILSPVALAQTPIQLKYECSPEDVETFGLPCTEDEPCPVFLELSSAEAAGPKLFAAGNLHTGSTTLFGVLLASEDNGVTWTEPFPRIRASALEQIEFFDPQTGWASGGSLDPLSRNPFLLVTADGGKTWRQRPMFDDTKYGAITQFHFTSRTAGELLMDVSQGRNTRQELYGSGTGGESWELKQSSTKPLRLTAPAKPAVWRMRADAASKTLRLEHANGRAWDLITSFAIHVADCH